MPASIAQAPHPSVSLPTTITATLVETASLVDDGWHNAFTDIVRWKGRTYVAYRRAPSHGIVPPRCSRQGTFDTGFA